MNISRSGYYKWLKNKDKLNNYEIVRRDLGELIIDIHKRKPSYGYHRINAIIKLEIGLVVSDNLVHKVCKLLGIKSRAKHYKYKKKTIGGVRKQHSPMVFYLRERTISFYVNYDEDNAKRSSHILYESFAELFLKSD